MSEQTISIDASAWLSRDGMVDVEVYFGRSCEPSYVHRVSLLDMIDAELAAMTAPRENKIPEYHAVDAKELIEFLKRATKYAKKRVKELS